MARKRRRKKNPDTSTLLLIGLGIGGYYLYKKSQQPVVTTPTPAQVNPIASLIGGVTSTVSSTLTGLLGGASKLLSGDKVLAGGGGVTLKQSGCYDSVSGALVASSKCDSLRKLLAGDASQLEGLGVLGSCGLGSLGGC